VGENYQSLQTPIGRVGSAFPQFQRSAQVYEVDLGASWEIDLFGGRRARDAARADWQASEAGAVAARLSVVAQIADTYVAIRMLQARLDVARAQLDTQQRLVDLVTLQYRKGVAADLQLRQAEGALAQVRSSIPALGNQLDIAMNALDVLIGAQPGSTRTELATAAPIPTAPAIAAAGGPAALLRRRPDIIAAERTLAASNARIGVAVAEYYPKFSLSGLAGTATTAAGGMFAAGSIQANGIMGLRWRLFDFGRVDAEIRAAKGRNAEALAAYRLAVLRASQDVEDAFSTLVKQEERASTLEDGQASLTRARDASLAAYKGGAVSLIEVLDADRRLLETRDGAIEARAAATRGHRLVPRVGRRMESANNGRMSTTPSAVKGSTMSKTLSGLEQVQAMLATGKQPPLRTKSGLCSKACAARRALPNCAAAKALPRACIMPGRRNSSRPANGARSGIRPAPQPPTRSKICAGRRWP
jgi:NodT family efflux transporter outer membrane factor (OMF) lipoprotein